MLYSPRLGVELSGGDQVTLNLKQSSDMIALRGIVGAGAIKGSLG